MKIECFYIKNDVFQEDTSSKIEIQCPTQQSQALLSDRSFLELLRSKPKEIIERKFGHISSFNFSKSVFYDGKWTELSKVARGLFLDNSTGQIVGRGFDKFFNYREKMFNQDRWLEENLKFPVTAYKKYNGFLGILAWDQVESKLLFLTKSMVDGAYSKIFSETFHDEFKDRSQEWWSDLASDLVSSNSCLVFEVIDPTRDPHIVKYEKPEVILLDMVKLEKTFSHPAYDDLVKFAGKFGFRAKEKAAVFEDWKSLREFIDLKQSYEKTRDEEGYVLEDSDGYHFKLKGGWYKFWKMMRGIQKDVAAGHLVSTSKLLTPLANDVYGFMTRELGREKLREMSIIDTREEFSKALYEA